MNNENGSIWFKSELDNSQLKRDTDQAKTHIKGLSQQVQSDSKKMNSSFSAVGKSLAAIGGTTAIIMLGKQILDTTAKFEKFGIVLKNTLGDIQGQAALDMIAQFAATTPFQLDEVTAAFIKMANQGFVPTREELVKLGDLASSTGKSFDQLAEALLDAQTGQFERLKEFGIKASANGDKVTFSFKEQQTTVDNTNSAIQKYILSLGELHGVAGANAKISESLTGQISNLEDKLAAMYNTIGSSNSGILYSAVGAASTLIENYETIGKVLLGLVAVYGAYKATVLIVNAVSAIQAQIAYQQTLANIGNTGATIQLTTAQGLQAVVASNLTRVQLALNKSMLANPYVMATLAVTGLIIAMTAYASSVEKAKTQKEILNDLEKESQKNTNQEVSKLESLKKILNDSNKSYGERKVALDNLKEIVPAYHADLTNEGVLINNNSDALDTYVKKLVIAEKIKIAAIKQSSADEAFNNYKNENKDVIRTATLKKINGEGLLTGERVVLETLRKLAEESQNYGAVIDQLQSDLVSIDAKGVKKEVSETPAQLKARLAQELKDKKEHDNLLKSYQSLYLAEKEKLDKDELELLRSKITNKKDLIDLEYEETIDAINKNEQAVKDAAKLAGIKPDLSVFDKQRTVAASKRVTDKDNVDKEELKVALEAYQTFLQKKEKLDSEYEKTRITLAGKPENLKALEKSYKASLKSLQSDLLDENGKGLVDLYLFGEGEDFIQAKIKAAFPEIKNLSEATISQLEEIKKYIGDIEFTPEQLKAFEELGIDVKKLLENLKKAKNEETNLFDEEKWEKIVGFASKIADSVGKLGNSLQGFGGSLGSIGSALSGISGEFDNIATIFSKEAKPEDIIESGISGLSSLIGMVANQIEANKEAQEEWNAKIEEGKHEMALLRIEADAYQQANIFGVENPYAKAISGAKQYADASKELYTATKALEGGQIQTGTKKVVDGGNVGTGVGSGAAVGAAVGTAVGGWALGLGTVIGAGIGALIGGIVGLASTKTVPVFASLKEKYGDVVDSSGNLNKKLLADYDKLDEATKKLVDNWEEIKSKQEEAQKQMEENFSKLAGDLGTSLSDALVEAFRNRDLYSAIDKFDKKMNDVISGIVEQLIFNTVFGQMFTDLEARFKASFGTGGDQSIVDDLQNFNDTYQTGLELYNALMEAADKELKNSGLGGFKSSQDAGSVGEYKAITSDQASGIDGRLTAMHIISIENNKILSIMNTSLSDIGINISDLQSIALDSWSELNSINKNTKLIKDTNEKLDLIISNTNRL